MVQECKLDHCQYTTSDWSLADTEYDRVRRALDEDRTAALKPPLVSVWNYDNL